MSDCRDCMYYIPGGGDYETPDPPECWEPRIGRIMTTWINWHWQGCKRITEKNIRGDRMLTRAQIQEKIKEYEDKLDGNPDPVESVVYLSKIGAFLMVLEGDG